MRKTKRIKACETKRQKRLKKLLSISKKLSNKKQRAQQRKRNMCGPFPYMFIIPFVNSNLFINLVSLKGETKLWTSAGRHALTGRDKTSPLGLLQIHNFLNSIFTEKPGVSPDYRGLPKAIIWPLLLSVSFLYNEGFLFLHIAFIFYFYNNFLIKKIEIDNILLLSPIQEKFQKWFFVADKMTSSSETNKNFSTKEPNDESKKKPSSWRQFFFLRLTIIFGLLLFLAFSYLLNESFNITKVYNQVIIFINDENVWNNSYRIIRKCWLTYLNIWGWRQWAVSVCGLLPLYWFLFDILYYVGLIEKKFTPRQKIFFILTDFLLNLIVGLAYMPHPETVIGELMYVCPVALSPYFIVAEIIGYLLYQAWLKYRAKK